MNPREAVAAWNRQNAKAREAYHTDPFALSRLIAHDYVTTRIADKRMRRLMRIEIESWGLPPTEAAAKWARTRTRADEQATYREDR